MQKAAITVANSDQQADNTVQKGELQAAITVAKANSELQVAITANANGELQAAITVKGGNQHDCRQPSLMQTAN